MTRRARMLFVIASALVACEGTMLRCDPSPSWSYAPNDPDAGASLAPARCERDACPIVDLVAGARHTCVRTASGAVFCWGSNDRGQSDPTRLGDDVFAPTRVLALEPISGSDVGLALGAAHTCVVDGDALACWGEPRVIGEGELGGATGRIVRVPVGASHGDVRAGALHTCTHVAQRAHDGSIAAVEARCFGAWDGVELGDARDAMHVLPGMRVDASGFVSCDTRALLDEGRVSCWGGAPPGGRLVPGPWLAREELELGTPIAGWALGAEHLCVQRGTTVRCRGRGDRGQLGNGRTISSDDFVDVLGLPPRPVVSMCAGGSGGLWDPDDGSMAAPPNGGFTCAIALQAVWCWGANHRGQLGDGTLADRAHAVRVLRIGISASRLACGEAHVCALTGSGVFCWGDNRHGQLGISRRELDHTSIAIPVSLVR